VNLSHSKADMTCVNLTKGDKIAATADAGVSGWGIYKSGPGPLTVLCNANLEEEMT